MRTQRFWIDGAAESVGAMLNETVLLGPPPDVTWPVRSNTSEDWSPVNAMLEAVALCERSERFGLAVVSVIV